MRFMSLFFTSITLPLYKQVTKIMLCKIDKPLLIFRLSHILHAIKLRVLMFARMLRVILFCAIWLIVLFRDGKNEQPQRKNYSSGGK